jgi:hypothetical protein
MGRSISDETCDQQMIFAISSRHDNQQCIDKIIDFTCHHLMTKPCRNVCGAQQLMKPAFSTPLMQPKAYQYSQGENHQGSETSHVRDMVKI